MSVINYLDQLNYVNKGYLDAKMQPVNTIDELDRIPRSQRFLGLTVTVLNDGNDLGPRDYWLKTSTSNWVVKEVPGIIFVTGDDIE